MVSNFLTAEHLPSLRLAPLGATGKRVVALRARLRRVGSSSLRQPVDSSDLRARFIVRVLQNWA